MSLNDKFQLLSITPWILGCSKVRMSLLVQVTSGGTGGNTKLIRGGLVCYLESFIHWHGGLTTGCSGTGTGCPGRWWNLQPCSEGVWMWHLGLWISARYGGADLMVGLDVVEVFSNLNKSSVVHWTIEKNWMYWLEWSLFSKQ